MDSSLQVLVEAVRNRTPATITARSHEFAQDMVQVLHVRFEGESNLPGETGIWAKAHSADGGSVAGVIGALVKSARTVEVSFDTQEAKVFFDSALLLARSGWWSSWFPWP